MGKTFKFWWLCSRTAFWGNAASANDWQWVFANPLWQSIGGAVGAGLGAFVSRYWRGAPMMSPETPIGVFLGGLFGFAFTWLIFFIVRFLRTPARLYYEQKERGDRLEELKQLAAEATRAPSFDLGFELLEIDIDAINLVPANQKEICRIWVENLTNHPIDDCRVFIEEFNPESPVKNGVMLLLDNRGSDKQQPAKFRLAPTQKRYLKFLQLADDFGKLKILIKSDQDRTDLWGMLEKAELKFGKRYFTTIAVHGQNANSRRISLTIDVVSEEKVSVLQALPPEQIKAEMAQ